MSLSTMNKLILVVFYFLISVSAGSLPENVYRVNSCPQGKNKTAWDEASKRLKCAEDSLKKIYHCLPSTYLNETIEFCGKLVAVSEGFCPIYNYANGATVATSRNCSNFTKGCPDPPSPPFHSTDFYRYPACFEINKYNRCYYAEANCPSEEKRYEPLAVTEEEISTTPSEILYTPPASMEKDEPLSKTLLIVLGVVIPVLGIALVILLVCVVYFYRKSKNTKRPEAESEETIPLTEEDPKDPDNEEKEMDGSKFQPENTDVKQIVIDETERQNKASEGSHFYEKGPECKDQQEDKAADKNVLDKTKINGSITKQDLNYVEKSSDDAVVESTISVKWDPDCSKKLRDENPEKDLNYVEKSSDDAVVESTISVIWDPDCSKKLRDENPEKDRNHVEKISNDAVVESTISVKWDPECSKKLRDENPEEDRNHVEKSSDNGVVESTISVKWDPECSKKLRDENPEEVKPCNKEVVVKNPSYLLSRIKYYHLWEKIIKAEAFFDLKLLLKGDGDQSCRDIDLVCEWENIHDFRNNIWLLQALLDICKANHLVSECAKYAESVDACYISRNYKENERDIIYIHTSLKVTDKDVAENMKNIQKCLAEYLEVKQEDIQLVGLKEGSLIFIFSLPKQMLPARSILPLSLENLLKKNKVFKVELPDATTMTGYQMFNVYVHLVCKVIHSTKEERLCIHMISRRLREKFEFSAFNFKVFEDLATVRSKRIHIPRHTRSITKEVKRKKIQRKKIQEEMEPSADLKSLKENFPEYCDTFELAVGQQSSRKEKSKMFFECLDKLEEKSSKEIQNFMFGKYAFGGKTFNDRDLSNRREKIKTIITSQRTTFLEEIESTFIDATLKSQDTAKDATKSFQDNKKLSRRERVHAFLDFVLKNEEFLIPFDDALNNNKDLFKTIQS